MLVSHSNNIQEPQNFCLSKTETFIFTAAIVNFISGIVIGSLGIVGMFTPALEGGLSMLTAALTPFLSITDALLNSASRITNIFCLAGLNGPIFIGGLLCILGTYSAYSIGILTVSVITLQCFCFYAI